MASQQIEQSTVASSATANEATKLFVPKMLSEDGDLTFFDARHPERLYTLSHNDIPDEVAKHLHLPSLGTESQKINTHRRLETGTANTANPGERHTLTNLAWKLGTAAVTLTAQSLAVNWANNVTNESTAACHSQVETLNHALEMVKADVVDRRAKDDWLCYENGETNLDGRNMVTCVDLSMSGVPRSVPEWAGEVGQKVRVFSCE
ncbi:hypothetical protein IAT38_007674 [Cryptococcus sp. DSM 104549]